MTRGARLLSLSVATRSASSCKEVAQKELNGPWWGERIMHDMNTCRMHGWWILFNVVTVQGSHLFITVTSPNCGWFLMYACGHAITNPKLLSSSVCIHVQWSPSVYSGLRCSHLFTMVTPLSPNCTVPAQIYIYTCLLCCLACCEGSPLHRKKHYFIQSESCRNRKDYVGMLYSETCLYRSP